MKRDITSMTTTNSWGIWDSALCNRKGNRVISHPGHSTGQVANPGKLGQVVRATDCSDDSALLLGASSI